MTYSIGIDSGSTATKGILLADGVITRRFLVPTPFRPATAITEARETLREGLETTPFLTLTGYGRQLVDFADKQVTEISCHGLGARFLAPATRAVIDIGGQDSKVIQLDDDGNLCDFLMNDKCAAGTGRFLGGDLAHAWHQRRATRQHYRKCHAARHHEYVHSVCRIRSDQPALSGRRARSDSRRSD